MTLKIASKTITTQVDTLFLRNFLLATERRIYDKTRSFFVAAVSIADYACGEVDPALLWFWNQKHLLSLLLLLLRMTDCLAWAA